MENIIRNLQGKSILHRDQVQQIKTYIDQKYTDYSAEQKAGIFANAVHQIVEESVSRFEKKHRVQIRAEVLKSAIAKDMFEISGYDIFEVCASLPLEDDDNMQEVFYTTLTQWVNDNQEEVVTIHETREMARTVLDNAVSSVVDALEESILIDREIIELNHKDESEVIKERLLEGELLQEDSEDQEELKQEDSEGQEELTQEDKKAHEELAWEEDKDQPVLLHDDMSVDEYYDNNLEDFVTDGRFMDTDGDIKELTSAEIEKAIKEAVMPVIDHVETPDLEEDIEPINNEEIPTVEKVVYSNLDDDIFDSMDMVFDDQEIEVSQEPVVENLHGGSSDDEYGWEEVELDKPKKIETTRLNGYEINPAQHEEQIREVMPQNIRLMLMLPVMVIMIMLIIVLIIGAIQITKQGRDSGTHEPNQMEETYNIDHEVDDAETASYNSDKAIYGTETASYNINREIVKTNIENYNIDKVIFCNGYMEMNSNITEQFLDDLEDPYDKIIS